MFEVFFLKEMKQILLSFSQVPQRSKIVSGSNTSKIFDKNKELFGIVRKNDGLYKMTSFFDAAEINVTSSMILKDKWHGTLGYLNLNYLNTFCEKQLLEGLPNELDSEYINCKVYRK